MSLEEIKREFVSFMEEARATEPYPRNFMGCLISIIIDPEPVSQERIVELTGYSQATVSLTLQRLQSLLPIRTTRIRGDRRHYYTYDGSPERFVVDLWQKRLDTQAISYQQIEKMLSKVKEKSAKNKSLKRFEDYLEYFLLILRIVSELRASGIKEFEQVLDSRKFGDLKSKRSLSDGEIAEFLTALRSKSLDSTKILDDDNRDSKEYLQLRQEYFSEIKTGFNPLFSQVAANQMIVVHSVFLEGCTTQQQLQDMTLLPRSTISEILKQFVNNGNGLIRTPRNEGSRIKVYYPTISFTELMLGNFNQMEKHISQVMPQLVEYAVQVRKINNSLNETKPFLDTLSRLEEAYAFTRDFSRRMKRTMVEKLKEKVDSGHVFI